MTTVKHDDKKCAVSAPDPDRFLIPSATFLKICIFSNLFRLFDDLQNFAFRVGIRMCSAESMLLK